MSKGTFNEAYRREFIEEPKLEHYKGEQSFIDPPKQRTWEQQKKQDKLIKQERREQGHDTNQSRSSSRRARRKRIQKGLDDNKYMRTNPLEALEEADANGDWDEMRPFERIGPDSTSMNGPVTLARAVRGEIPMRGSGYPPGDGGDPLYPHPRTLRREARPLGVGVQREV